MVMPASIQRMPSILRLATGRVAREGQSRSGNTPCGHRLENLNLIVFAFRSLSVCTFSVAEFLIPNCGQPIRQCVSHLNSSLLVV